MPKGKPKARNPGLYTEEDSEVRHQRNMAPQAAPHKRGGTHCLKDEHRTNTHWDDKNYQELQFAAREAGIWRKDMPKWRMIQELANKDREDARAGFRVRKEAARKRKAEEERRRREKEKKKRAREARRVAGEEVSGTSDEEPIAAHENIGFGQLLTEDDWTQSSTTTQASLSPIFPAQKLRIYEWPYSHMPSSNPLHNPTSPPGTVGKHVPELLPRKVPYIAMDVVTTVSNENLQLPGRAMPDEVKPDYVLMLSEHTRHCARNGILFGQLANAVIERAADWAARTQLQWWNGRMYFNLPPRKSKASLQDVYSKWKQKKYLRSKVQLTRGIGITKPELKKKEEQRLKDRRDKIIEVYAASEHRPLICYVPSYMDFPLLDDDEEMEKRADNLFYVRFRNMALPHYYFWTSPGEWEDPTIPNPDWIQIEAQNQPITDTMEAEGAAGQRGTRRVLVKRSPVPRNFLASAQPPKASKYKTAVWAIERDLYHNGWANVMYVYRDKWLREGKEKEWRRLIADLPILFPSGNLPTAPPVSVPGYVSSLAEKFAAVDVPSPQWQVQPVRGDESWTRDDQAYWTLVDIPEAISESGIQQELLRTMSPAEESALNRRLSEVAAWITNTVSPYQSPTTSPTRPLRVPTSPTSPSGIRTAEREAWEELFLKNVEAEAALLSQIEQMPVTELKHSLYALMNEVRRQSWSEDRCSVCLKSLNTADQDATRAHYDAHRKEADAVCPFCDMYWVGLNSEMKAAHIFYHDMEKRPNRWRRSSANPFPSQPLYAIPKKGKSTTPSEQHESAEVAAGPSRRRDSKVTFSPVTVEKRVGYNDTEEDPGMDADLSSVAMTSPRRSSLRKLPPKTKTSLKTPCSANTVTKRIAPPRLRTASLSSMSLDSSNNPEGKKRKPNLPQQSYREPSTPSTHIESPKLPAARGGRPYPSDHPLAAWDPMKHSTSGSDHVASPYLPQFPHYPPGHPDATYDPRKASQSSYESLEWIPRRRAAREKKAIEANGQVRKGTAAGKGDQSKKGTKQKMSGPASTQARIQKRKRKLDPSYRDVSPSSCSRSPVFAYRRPRADPPYRNVQEPSSPSTGDERPAKRRKTGKPRIKIRETQALLQELAPSGQETAHSDSTASNFSSVSDHWRSTALVTPDLDVTKKPKTGIRRKAPDLAAEAKRRKPCSSVSSQTLRIG